MLNVDITIITHIPMCVLPNNNTILCVHLRVFLYVRVHMRWQRGEIRLKVIDYDEIRITSGLNTFVVVVVVVGCISS